MPEEVSIPRALTTPIALRSARYLEAPTVRMPLPTHRGNPVTEDQGFPRLLQVVLDCPDARALAEFYRRLLGLAYRPGDGPPAAGEPDLRGRDWLVLLDSAGKRRLAFQQVAKLAEATWPEGPIPQQLHLDLAVRTTQQLNAQHERALALGARLLRDCFDDPEEPLRVYADPAGHPFCIFVAHDS
jgi:hypothetical protein